MEYMITEELREALQVLEADADRVQIGKILAPSVINVLWALTAGSRISRTDPRLQNLLELLNRRSKAFDMSGGTLSQHPWLRYIAPEKTGYNLLQKLNKELRELFMATINEHHQQWSEGRNDDIIYSFITEMKRSDKAESTFTGNWGAYSSSVKCLSVPKFFIFRRSACNDLSGCFPCWFTDYE